MQNFEEVKVTGFTFLYGEALAVSEFIDKILTFCNEEQVDCDRVDEVLNDVKTQLDEKMTVVNTDPDARLNDEEYFVNLKDWTDYDF